MPNLESQLNLERCPHCSVDKPSLVAVTGPFETFTYEGGHKRCWKAYKCSRCGGVIIAASANDRGIIDEIYPKGTEVDKVILEPAHNYLEQAINSLHSPAGSVMLAASAVDAMLKIKSYKEGSLSARIDKAAEDHLITREMAQWAHQIRLDANDQRHADEGTPLPTEEDAQKCVEFAKALGEFLFVLPSRVTRGLKDAVKGKETP